MLILPLDLSTVEGSESAIVKTVERFTSKKTVHQMKHLPYTPLSGLDIVIISAGFAHPEAYGNLTTNTMDGFKETFDLNFLSPVAMTKVALPAATPGEDQGQHSLPFICRGYSYDYYSWTFLILPTGPVGPVGRGC